jgi:formate dehydrogenase gamma subunit
MLLIGIGLTGSLLAYHPPVQLLDKEMEFINPITGENDSLPFSTKQTCGLCHDYDLITEAYHFQTGWDVISDTFGVRLGKPWMLSDGMLGKWGVQSFRQLARKENDHPAEIDLTVYEFIGGAGYTRGQPTCGSCHSGGGGLEFDRDGERYDYRLDDEPELRESLDGDYYRANWDRSGVVEADCFVCHWTDYNFEERVSQLRKRNYQWAVVGASGIGVIDGSVSRGDEPQVKYNERFFDADGMLVFDPAWPPPDENCMFCHGAPGARKRGFSWDDFHNPDVHDQQGISCTHCHHADEDHQLAKGRAFELSVADELDTTVTTCQECHERGLFGATIPEHASIRPSHLDRIACESCHIPKLNRSAISGIEYIEGETKYIMRPEDASQFGEIAQWRPFYERHEDGVIYPINNVLSVWFANLDNDSIAYPLFIEEHKAAWDIYEDQIADDNNDGDPEINTHAEIAAALSGVAESLEGNARFESVNPVYVKGGKYYALDNSGELVQLDLNIEQEMAYSIDHNVAKRALGAGGCSDCHVSEAHFFKGQRIVDLYDTLGQVVTKSNGRWFDCNVVAFAVNSFHQRILSPVVSIGIILVVFLVTLHYHSVGPKRVQFRYGSGEIERFSLYERGIHLFRLISFVILAITGLILAFNLSGWQQLLFASPHQMLWIHIISGFVFILTTVLGIAAWFKDAIFASYDREWVKRIGGYLGFKGEVPAGRFNAGQKMFYWYSTIFGLIMSITGMLLVFKYSFPLSTICMTSTIHNFFGFVLIAGVLAHAYLGTVANPGTWRVLVDGYVTREWAKHHHPNWYRKLIRKEPEVVQTEEEKTDADNQEDNDKDDQKENPEA